MSTSTYSTQFNPPLPGSDKSFEKLLENVVTQHEMMQHRLKAFTPNARLNAVRHNFGPLIEKGETICAEKIGAVLLAMEEREKILKRHYTTVEQQLRQAREQLQKICGTFTTPRDNLGRRGLRNRAFREKQYKKASAIHRHVESISAKVPENEEEVLAYSERFLDMIDYTIENYAPLDRELTADGVGSFSSHEIPLTIIQRLTEYIIATNKKKTGENVDGLDPRKKGLDYILKHDKFGNDMHMMEIWAQEVALGAFRQRSDAFKKSADALKKREVELQRRIDELEARAKNSAGLRGCAQDDHDEEAHDTELQNLRADMESISKRSFDEFSGDQNTDGTEANHSSKRICLNSSSSFSASSENSGPSDSIFSRSPSPHTWSRGEHELSPSPEPEIGVPIGTPHFDTRYLEATVPIRMSSFAWQALVSMWRSS